jgi:hypothetical protein
VLALKDGDHGLIPHSHAGCTRSAIYNELRRHLLDPVGNTPPGINATGYGSREEDAERIRVCQPYPEALR